ncbi:MAG TPA: ABC transporter permease [Thermoanaerobaculia bacterium]|nr:ABC transporter permease [Thermoanaerobaculia bacterium]
MLAVFRDELAERRARGRPRDLVVFWSALVADLIAVAWTERSRRRDAFTSGGRGDRRRHGPERRQTMEHWLLDLKAGLRALRRSPSYAITAIVILGLAVGASATIFSLVHVLFVVDPPHVVEPERLVRVHRTSGLSDVGSLSYPDFAHFHEHSETLDGLAAYDPDGVSLAVKRGAAREAMLGWLVSWSFFDVLGTRPAAGRWFHPDEDVVGAPAQVAVISHRAWTTLFGGDAGAIGSTLTLNGHPFTIVGVAPAGFRGVSPIEGQPDVWVPLTNQPVLTPLSGDFALKRVPATSWVWLWTVGRLAPDGTVEQAGAELSRLAGQLAQDFPEWNEGVGAEVTDGIGLHPRTRGGLATVAQVLAGVVAIVLLIATVNVAILLLARSTVRRREAGVRLAIGASRTRIIRLMLVESLLLSVAGGFVGLLLAFSTARLAASLLPVTLAVDVRPSPVVMLFAFGVSAGAAVLFTAIPALRSSRQSVTALFRPGADGRGWRLQAGLVALQVALSVMLVVSGALLVRSLSNARAVDLGFGVSGRTVLSVNLRNHGYGEREAWQYARTALERLRAVPSVDVATATVMIPFRGGWTGSVFPEGNPMTEGFEVTSGFNAVAPGYFAAMDIPIVAGRPPSDRDVDGEPLIAVVNEAFAESHFPGEQAVGKRIYGDAGKPPYVIVGVARNARYYELDEDPKQMIYLSLFQRPTPSLRFLVRSKLGAGTLEPSLEEALVSVDSEVALGDTTTLERVVGEELGRYRTGAVLVGLFATLSLILASVGLYGALSYLVVQRTREIGIRVAIGARPGELARSVVRRGLVMAGSGLLAGLVGASWATRWLESLLFGLEALDPVTFAFSPLVLLAVAAAASLLPARRAMGVDPIQAMRVD